MSRGAEASGELAVTVTFVTCVAAVHRISQETRMSLILFESKFSGNTGSWLSLPQRLHHKFTHLSKLVSWPSLGLRTNQQKLYWAGFLHIHVLLQHPLFDPTGTVPTVPLPGVVFTELGESASFSSILLVHRVMKYLQNTLQLWSYLSLWDSQLFKTLNERYRCFFIWYFVCFKVPIPDGHLPR